MKKQIILSIAIFMLTFSVVVAQDKGIHFEKGTWAEVKAKAKAENKHIFVDAYTTWCGPCKWMAKNTFTDEKVGEFFTKNYIAYKLDMEKEGDGLDFAKKYKVWAVSPSLYISVPRYFFLEPRESMMVSNFSFSSAGGSRAKSTFSSIFGSSFQFRWHGRI